MSKVDPSKAKEAKAEFDLGMKACVYARSPGDSAGRHSPHATDSCHPTPRTPLPAVQYHDEHVQVEGRLPVRGAALQELGCAAGPRAYVDSATSAVRGGRSWASADRRLLAPRHRRRRRVGRLYKAAGLHDSALEALRKAVHCAVKMGNMKQAAATLESTAREWSLLPGKGKETAAELYAEAAEHLVDAGEPVRAADVMLLAGKQCEAFDKDRAAKLFDAAAAVFDGQDDKDVYAVQPLQKVLREQLNVGKHASAMRTLDKLLKARTCGRTCGGGAAETRVDSRLTMRNPCPIPPPPPTPHARRSTRASRNHTTSLRRCCRASCCCSRPRTPSQRSASSSCR